MVRYLGALLLALAACGDTAPVFAPIVDSPLAGSPADPFPGLDQLELSVAVAGDPGDLASATFPRGRAVELTNVPFGTDLVVHLAGQVGGSEVAYGRTCAFDLVAGAPTPTPHLYFARTVKWATAAAPAIATRTGGFAWAAADGSGVFVGGADPATGAPAVAIDRFDPSSGGFVDVADLAARTGAAFTPFPGGRALAVGGTDPATGDPVGAIEVINPLAAAGRRVERIDDARVARSGATVTELSSGDAVLIGGADVGHTLRSDVVLLQDDAGTIALRDLRATLAWPRAGATVTRLSDDVGAPLIVIGGRGAKRALIATAELYKPLSEAFADPATFHPDMLWPRTQHLAVRTPDGSILIIGGLDAHGEPVHKLELFALDTGFRDAGSLPAGAGVIDLTATTLPDGRILLAGGRATHGGPPLATAYIARLDPVDGSVDVGETNQLSTPRAGHTAVALCDGTVLLVGGTATPSPSERYNPPSVGRR
ncbi:MAG: hypothetical protein K8W52_32625 [Deltaproteobacteria bacterium]|nr:hypothetical protein [Deltaproteobacteria bacterium]